MTAILRTAIFAALCLGVLAPPSARAQEPLTAIASQIEGRTVIITGHDGSKVQGRVLSVSDSAVVLSQQDGLERSFTLSSVREIKRPGPIWDGVVKGAAIGGGIAGIINILYSVEAEPAVTAVLFCAGIGAGIGVGIDALFGPKRIYRAAGSRVSVTPLVGRGAGARLSLTF